jgi:hypothetical protein
VSMYIYTSLFLLYQPQEMMEYSPLLFSSATSMAGQVGLCWGAREQAEIIWIFGKLHECIQLLVSRFPPPCPSRLAL